MGEAPPGRAWGRLRGENSAGPSIRVERRPASTVWVLLEGRLTATAAGRFVADLRAALVARRKDRVVLDLARLAGLEDGAVGVLVAGLEGHRDRIRIILPRMGEFAALAAIFSLYR
jgi:anti-anti-sigma regulatory factor